MTWIKFKNKNQIDLFLSAATALYAEILKDLDISERPFFYNYWLHRLNLCHVYLFMENKRPKAMVSYPKVRGAHRARWQYPTLVCANGIRNLDLPLSLKKFNRFIMPYSEQHDYSVIKFAKHELIQFGYVGRLKNRLKTKNKSKVEQVKGQSTQSLIKLWKDCYKADSLDSEFLPYFLADIRRLKSNPSSWCFFIDDGSGKPIAASLYYAHQVPLLGIPAALVGDIVVRPNMRGAGFATRLQSVAQSQLNQLGLLRVVGNIMQNNYSSIKQAENTGRSILYTAVKFNPLK